LKFRSPLLAPTLTTALALTFLSGCSLFSAPLSTEQRTLEIEVQKTSAVDEATYLRAPGSSTLRLLSLNMAHGRKDSFSQFFVSEADIRQNLYDIVEFLKRQNADVVTLQEADSPSWWSGDFDHVELLAREAGYAWYTHANHVDNLFGTYGTAVLSRFPITRGYRIDFNPTPPTTRKGFTLAEIEWNPENSTDDSLTIDVLSVHLDFSRRSKRIEQIADMNEVLAQRSNPAIVLGDFNSTWMDGEHQLQALAKSKALKTHRPDANHLYTYVEERIDWILIAEEFEFCNYYVASDTLSDHRAVISEVVAIDEDLKLAGCDIL
jgi:endonuclease/exonuclease/phosphatase family metal-dependent hydrolase